MFEKYKTEIIKQFAYAKENDVIGIFNNLTPAECRDYFILLYDNKKLTEDDKSVMRSFFKAKEGENLKILINNCKLSSFRPVISFLKEEKKSEHKVRINLAAILVDFEKRPFSRFSKEFDQITDLVNNSNENDKTEINHSDQNDEKKDGEKISIIEIPPVKPTIVIIIKDWFQKNNKSLFIGAISLVTIIFGINHFKYENGCMAWMKDHYEEIDCNALNENPNLIIVAKDDNLIQNFKKIIPCDTTKYERNGRTCLWYGKSLEGKYEFFTALYFHPETGITLKKVTSTIMKNYGRGPCK